MALNLEKQLRFYGAFHHNPVNIAIHIICVPLLMMTAFLIATNSGDLPLPDNFTIPHLPINAGTVWCIIYASLYVLMEPVAGAMLAPLMLAGTVYGNHLRAQYGADANYWAAGLHTASWIVQFIGHGFFEGRAPALLDNIGQALFLAPFFVWLEVLFMFGYRPELKHRLDQGVEEDIDKFRGTKTKKGESKT